MAAGVSGVLDSFRRWLARLRARAAAHLSILAVFVPITLLALLLAAYGWWWRVVADGVRQNAIAFQATQQALGREVTWDGLSIAGFPYRVEATLVQPHVTAPDRGTGWDGERVVVHVQPLALNRIGFSLEGQQHLLYAMEGHWVEVYGRADKALVTLASGATQHADVEIERLTGKVTIDAADTNVIVEEADADLRVSDANEREPLPRVELVARLKNIALQGKIDLPLGRTISLFEIDAGVKFPTNLPEVSATTLVAAWRNSGTPVDLRRFELEWGGVHISASGEFKLDAQSLPEGRVLLKLGNHPRILELLEAYGWITKETHSAAKSVLDVLAFFSGDPERRVAVPLRIEKGVVYLGLVRVATLQPPATAAQLVP